MNDLKSCNTRADLAAAIGVSESTLSWVITAPNAKKYSVFEVEEKSKVRTIEAPNGSTLYVQKRLAPLLDMLYKKKPIAHGFIKGHSIITNASVHVRAIWILNMDIKSFFPSISRVRILGMLRSSYYGLHPNVAADISRIVTFGDRLPTGAPTSGVVANIICGPLDSELLAYAKENKFLVTRYADDITFSSSRRTSLDRIAAERGSDGQPSIDPVLIEIIHSNGFELNPEKTRIMVGSSRKSVTGIIVNRKLNVKREFMKTTRSAINAVEKYGYDKANDIFLEKYRRKGSQANILSYIRGRLAFICAVRTQKDSTVQALARRFNAIPNVGKKIIAPGRYETYARSVFVLEGHDCTSQGTCFFISDRLLVTAAHAVPESNAYIMSPSFSSKTYDVTVKHKDDHRDFAVLELTGDPIDGTAPLLIAPGNKGPTVGSNVCILGFPNYAPGKDLNLRDTTISAPRTRNGVNHYAVDAPIISGNSGGPVLDQQDRVVGIAVRGGNSITEATGTDENLVLKLDEFEARLREFVEVKVSIASTSTPAQVSSQAPSQDDKQ